MAVIDRADLAADPLLADNAGRVVHVGELDAAIGTWTARRSVAQVLAELDQASVPAGKSCATRFGTNRMEWSATQRQAMRT